MNVELLQTLSVAAYIAAGVLLLVTIVLFFLFKVPELFCDLTGITARRGIESIRAQSSDNGSGALHTPKKKSPVSKMMTESGSLRQQSAPAGESQQTSKLETTELVVSAETTMLMQPSVPTGTDSNTQAVPAAAQPAPQAVADAMFEVVEEFSFTSSSEIIP